MPQTVDTNKTVERPLEKPKTEVRPPRFEQVKRPIRWIQWAAVLVIAAVGAAVIGIWLYDGGDEVVAYDRGAEHGAYTVFVGPRDLTGVDLPRFVGTDVPLDEAGYMVLEHRAFTEFAGPRDLTGVELPRFAGTDVAFDVDPTVNHEFAHIIGKLWIPEHGEFTLFAGIPDYTGVDLPRFAGGDAALD